MNFYCSKFFNPFFNIATEEFFFKQKTGDYFLLYRNEPSVIIGKHQNAFAEVNIPAIESRKIPLIRRLSGGGTVFHDLGNINFSFIVNKTAKNLVNFREHIQPIYDLLVELGIDVAYSKRNDLFIKGKKISGNAEHVFKNRVLHHGTLLFNTDLDLLHESLKSDANAYHGKAIKSVRSSVDNMANHLKDNMEIDSLVNLIAEKIGKKHKKLNHFQLNTKEAQYIDVLVQEKYDTWQWNYGYSPDFEINKKIENEFGYVSNKSLIKKGIIHQIYLKSDFVEGNLLDEIKDQLINQPFEFNSIRNNLYKKNRIGIDLLDLFF